MRELRNRLKAAGERLRERTGFPDEPAAFLRQRAEALRERARQWRPRAEPPVVSEPVEAAPPRWRNVWAQPAAESTASVPSPEAATDTGWQEHLPARKQILRTLGLALLVILALPYALIPVYRVIDPPFSSLMTRQFLTGVNVRQQWVDFEDISPALPRAVVISEDAAFCRHWGVDWNAVSDALEDAEDGNGVRGASTIPMQTAKNLFLWNGHSYIRKIMEVPLAYTMSVFWPKRRMLEIYLNIAEWGPNIYGIEAAAQYHFGRSAKNLTRRQAALLTVALPNPITRNPAKPGPGLRRLANVIERRAARAGGYIGCLE
jgi:monofunctional biosynthetic peptidoglycan transglycosylase